MRRSKMNLSLIANPTIRKTTFKKRKRGLLKKMYELTTLCDVKACAVIYSPDEPIPEVWPSAEGVEEVTSMFMELPGSERSKRMMNQETYLLDRIIKEQRQVKRLSSNNRETELRQLMFDILEGKTNPRQCDPRNLQDLSLFIHDYLKKLNYRINELTENGEGSSSLPPLPATFADANPHVVADAGYGQFQYHNMHEPVQYHAPIGLNDQIQYQHGPVQHVSDAFNGQIQSLNMNQNQHDSVQYHAPTGLNDHIQNQNQYEPVQYYAPTGLNDQIQYQNMNMNQNQYELVQYQSQQMGYVGEHVHNQYQQEPVQYQAQEMGNVGEHAQFPFMDEYIKLLTGDLATTSLMPFTTTTNATAGVHAPYINKNP